MERRPNRWRVASATALLAGSACAAQAAELKPYGFVLVNMIEHWNRPNGIDIPTQALSTDLPDTRDAYNNIHARQTRLGLKAEEVAGPAASQASAAVELDLWGNRATGAAANDVLQAGPRLRLAYGKLQWDRNSLVVGQDWVTAFSPLNPTSLMHQAITAMSASGNLWNRTPQVRWEGRLEPAALPVTLNMRAALVRSFSADAAGAGTVTQTDQPGSGEASGSPAYQVLGEAVKKLAGRDFVVGLSGQYLRQRFRPGVIAGPGTAPGGLAKSWLGSIHASLPVCPHFEVSGEGFFGRGDPNLQGLGRVYASGTQVRASQTRGGWVQLTAKPAEGWKANFIWGGEKVEETGLAAGTIYRNETATLNAIWDWSKDFAFSAEYGLIRTYFVGIAAGRTHNLGLAAMYKFGL